MEPSLQALLAEFTFEAGEPVMFAGDGTIGAPALVTGDAGASPRAATGYAHRLTSA
jgi:hypothetical protein